MVIAFINLVIDNTFINLIDKLNLVIDNNR